MKVVVLGGINEDVVAHVATLPARGETVAARGVERSAGGKGLNQAVAAARYGADTILLGAVGNDAAGESLRRTVRDAGASDAAIAVRDDVPTGQALICLSATGENTIVVNAAANAHFGATDVVAAAPAAPAVFLTQFEATLEAVEALFRLPSAAAGIRILNAAPALIEGEHLLALADILILNETELQRFARLASVPDDRDAIAAAARTLIERPGQRAIVTLGGAGCVLVEADRTTAFAAFPATPVDTIGAGDCFCGVLAAALAEGAGIEDAIRTGSAAAALSVERRGAAASSPTRAQVHAKMAAASG